MSKKNTFANLLREAAELGATVSVTPYIGEDELVEIYATIDGHDCESVDARVITKPFETVIPLLTDRAAGGRRGG